MTYQIEGESFDRRGGASDEITLREVPASYFWEWLSREVPLNLAMWRASELAALSGLKVRGPVLDIGCGNGMIASMIFTDPVDVGIDLWPNRLTKALARGAYRAVRPANAAALPFGDATF